MAPFLMVPPQWLSFVQKFTFTTSYLLEDRLLLIYNDFCLRIMLRGGISLNVARRLVNNSRAELNTQEIVDKAKSVIQNAGNEDVVYVKLVDQLIVYDGF